MEQMRGLERMLSDVRVYYNPARVDAWLAGNTPLGNCQECRVRRCALGIPLSWFGPAPHRGLAANSRWTG